MHATLPLVDLRPHPHNPRGIIDPDDVRDLVALIEKQGQLSPIVVHQVEGKPGYEILAGHRRAVALGVLGRKTADCNVLDPETALDWEALLLSETLSHKDLPPFATAAHVARLCARPGATVKSVAAELEKPREWVALRRALANLLPEIRKEHESPKGRMRHWTMGMLEIIAELPHETQRNLLAANNGFWARDIHGEEAVRRGVASERHTLKHAPFDVEDATLKPKAGSCRSCPNHTHAQPDLFGADEGDLADLGKAQCLLPRCYLEKVEAHNERSIAAAREKHSDLVLVHGGYDGVPGRTPQQQVPGALHHYQYRPSKAGAKGAVPAYVVDGRGAGKVVHVVPERGELVAAAKTAREKPKGEKAEPTVQERKARLEMRRRALEVDLIRGQVSDEQPPAAPIVAALLSGFGVADVWRDRVTRVKDVQKVFDASARGIDAAWSQRVWRGVQTRLVETLMRPSAEVSDDLYELARWIATVLKVDVLRVRARAEQEVPVPKVLQSQMGDEAGKGERGRPGKKKPLATPWPGAAPRRRSRRAVGQAAAAGERDED